MDGDPKVVSDFPSTWSTLSLISTRLGFVLDFINLMLALIRPHFSTNVFLVKSYFRRGSTLHCKSSCLKEREETYEKRRKEEKKVYLLRREMGKE